MKCAPGVVWQFRTPASSARPTYAQKWNLRLPTCPLLRCSHREFGVNSGKDRTCRTYGSRPGYPKGVPGWQPRCPPLGLVGRGCVVSRLAWTDPASLEVERPRLPWWTLLPRKLLLAASPVIVVVVGVMVLVFLVRRVCATPVSDRRDDPDQSGHVLLAVGGGLVTRRGSRRLLVVGLRASRLLRPDAGLENASPSAGTRSTLTRRPSTSAGDWSAGLAPGCYSWSIKSGSRGERLIPLPSWAVTMTQAHRPADRRRPRKVIGVREGVRRKVPRDLDWLTLADRLPGQMVRRQGLEPRTR